MEMDKPKQKRLELDARGEEVVAKANDFVRARHTLSVVEHRIVVMLIADLGRLREFPIQELSLRRIASAANVGSKDLVRRAQEICDNLASKTVDIHDRTEDGRARYTTVNCFSMCQYVEGSGTIRARFAKDMQAFLLNFKDRFTLYLLTVFLRLDSKHSTRIYEHLKMRQNLRVLHMPVEELRQMLAIEDKYPKFSHVRRHVIEKARTELGKKADITFTYKVRRDGQTPESIDFFIHENEEVVERLEHEMPELKTEDKPDMEENASTEGPTVNVRDLFLAKLNQQELKEITRAKTQALQSKAEEQLGHPDSSPSEAYQTARRMYRIYDG